MAANNANLQTVMTLITTAGTAKSQLMTLLNELKASRRPLQALTPADFAPIHEQLKRAHQLQTQLTSRLAATGEAPDVLTVHAMDILMSADDQFQWLQLLSQIPENDQ